jgi:hypothetical protein
MFTPSVILLVMANTLAATGAVLVALQAAMFETGRAASPGVHDEGAESLTPTDLCNWQLGEVADAA